MLKQPWVCFFALLLTALCGCDSRLPQGTIDSAVATDSSSVPADGAVDAPFDQALDVGLIAQTSFPYADVRPSCAPWDGPALELRLGSTGEACSNTDEHTIALTVYIWNVSAIDGTSVRPLTFSLGDTKQGAQLEGTVKHCATTTGSCENATNTVFKVERYTRDSAFVGSVSATFPSGKTISGSFSATWCDLKVQCG
ncbi:MAG: hypothetical protein H6707_20230 [Deltaproteobacteria bacterium]|nr:hypothetical protein [Deltaproteobacteria bacterium]